MWEKEKLYDLYNCEQVFQFECPRQWAQLNETTDPGVRFCDTCRKSVYFCTTPEEFVRQGELGRCVAISPTVTIKKELEGQRLVPLGMPSPAALERFEQERRLTRSWWGEVLELDPDLPIESRTLEKAKVLIEVSKQVELESKICAAKRAAFAVAEQARKERQIKVQAELAKIEAMSDREAYGRVGNCPKCGFSHRWDGARCSHCGHCPSA